MKLFSVPADFRVGTIDQFAELNERHEDAAICETYGSVTIGGFSGSGRPYTSLPHVDLRQLEEYVRYAAFRGIDFNYTLNASCAGNLELKGSGLRRAERFISQLWDMGVNNLTVSMPTMMVLVKESGHPFSIKASTICQINSAYKARLYRDRGLKRMVIDEDITRDFRRIRQICETFGDGVEMIVNSLCIKDCPNKMFHYNHESHFSAGQDVRTYYTYYCPAASTISDPTNIMRLNWVRPEDLHLYERAGIRRFKLQGRHLALHGDLLKAVETYMAGTYHGNLYDLLFLFDPRMRSMIPYYPYIDNDALSGFLEPFSDDPEHCTDDCDACGYCGVFAAAAMDTEANRALVPLAKVTIGRREEPFAAYRREHAVKRVAARMARQGYSLASEIKHRVPRQRG